MFGLDMDERRAKELADRELSEQLIEITATIDTLQARRLEIAGEWDERRLWAFDGCARAPQWLTQQAGMAPGEAAGLMWLARRLRHDMPQTRRAVNDGQVTASQAKILAGAVNEHTREAFAEAEFELVDSARGLGFDELQKHVNGWKLAADQEGPVPSAERLRDQRKVSLRRRGDGSWKLDGQLDPESGEIINSELRRIGEVLFRSEEAETTDDPNRQARTPGQRQADALVDMARRSARHNDQTSNGQPLLFVRVDLATLLGGDGHATLGDSQTPVPGETARRLACDSTLVRYVLGADGELLDLGRTARTASPGQRRGLILRDGPSCAFPGCDIPHHFCQAHHLDWWERGGKTDLDNMAMLCHRHHHMLHEGKWTLTRQADGRCRANPPPRC